MVLGDVCVTNHFPLYGITAFCLSEVGLVAGIAVLCSIVETWMREAVQKGLTADSAKRDIERLLSGFCDVAIRLDSKFCITDATAQLIHLMCPTTPLQPEVLNGRPLSTYLASESDVDKFHAHMSACSVEVSQGPPKALCVNLHHTDGPEVPVEIFHVTSQGMDDKPQYLLGVREVRMDGQPPDESLFQGAKTSFGPGVASTSSAGQAAPLSRVGPAGTAKKSSHTCPSARGETTTALKRKLTGLDSIMLNINLADQSDVQMPIQRYSLVCSEGNNKSTTLESCLVRGDAADAFLRWFAVSTNELLNGYADHADYVHNVVFRPPTVACASSKVILCAESARLSCSNAESLDCDDEAMKLEFIGVSQVFGRALHTTKRDSLPSLSESSVDDDEDSPVPSTHLPPVQRPTTSFV